MSFEVTILGSGAALPTLQRNPTSQYVICNDRHFLIDCGEGTQVQIRKRGIKLQKINHIFISHMHGDHFFGLVGLLSTMHLLGRDAGLTVYGPEELEGIVRSQLEIGGGKLNFNVEFVQLNGKESKCIFEDKMLEVHVFPLRHRIPANGFVIREKHKERNLIGEVFRASGLSLMAIPKFRNGEDYIDEAGVTHEVSAYTYAPKRAKAYAFCSDTAYEESIIPHIQGVDLLYHEATFTDKYEGRAKATYHSTAREAATIALKSNVKRLILGHLSARFESSAEHVREAAEVFQPVQVVEDGDVFTL
jgi:ribonuclease Z